MVGGSQVAGFKRGVLGPLARMGHRLKRYVLVEGLSRSAAVLVLLAAIQLLLDRTLLLGVGPRAAMLVVLLGVAGHQFYRHVVRPALVRVNVNDLAAVLERHHRGFGDELVSAVAFATGAGGNPLRDSPAMVEAVITDAAGRFERLPTRGVLRRDRYRRFFALGLAALALATGMFALAPETMATYVARDLLLGDAAWPSNTRIVLEGFRNARLRWPLGDDLTLVARAEERVPSALRAEFEDASGRRVVRDMDRRGENHFILDFGPLTSAMKVRCLIRRFGVDERTAWSSIEAIARPGVEAVRIEVRPPVYARQPAYVLPSGQASADIIRGSGVRIHVTMSKPVVASVLRRMDGQAAAGHARIEGGTRVSAEFVPKRGGTFFFDVRDEAGLEDRHPVTYTFDLIPDPPPTVRLTLPGTGELVVPNAILDLQVACEDNLGLKSVSLVHRLRPGDKNAGRAATSQQVEDGQAGEALSGFVPGQLRYELRQPWSLLPLTLSPGDKLTLQVRAEDYQPPVVTREKGAGADQPHGAVVDGTGGPVGVSLAYTMRIVTAEELLVDLGRRENEWRREFEQIIKAQERIVRRVMELKDQAAGEKGSARRSASYGSEARTQRQQAPRCKTVARQFAQILNELKVNQLDTPAVRRRLGGGVLRPLRALINTDLPAAADMIERLSRDFDADVADHLEKQEGRIVRTMYGVLANMLKWEGYNEAVALLRDIVGLQETLNEDTEAALQRELDKLFGSETTSKPADRR